MTIFLSFEFCIRLTLVTYCISCTFEHNLELQSIFSIIYLFYTKYCRTLRRPGQSPEKVSRGMILAPVAGIILNLFDACTIPKQNNIVGIFTSMECPNTVLCGFQYLLDYNWVSLRPLELVFPQLLICPWMLLCSNAFAIFECGLCDIQNMIL